MTYTRKMMSQPELSEHLTNKLRTFEECSDCSVSVRYVYQEPDAQGCNWSPDVMIRMGADASKETVTNIVSKLVEELRNEVNIST